MNWWKVSADMALLNKSIVFSVPFEADLGEFINILRESGFIEFNIEIEKVVNG